jgi:glycosyltransferase involved in cell wall biosynthesis
MTEPARPILLVAGRLGVHDEGWSIRPFLDRLGREGVAAQVVCTGAAGEAAADFRVVGCPGLGQRWRLPLAARGLRFGERLQRPELCHVLGGRMSDVGLAIAEHWRIPYVQTIDEFVPAGGGLRISRRWCRRLVATSRELADDLKAQLGIPGDLIAVVNPGIEVPEAEPARDAAGPGGRVAVIGTAGPLVAASGFATFLNAARRVIDAGVDAEFVIAGQGEDEVDLRRRADRLRIADRVTFAGIPVVGLRFWSVLDVFCQPSLVPSVARTLATALAFGVPAIASDIEGLRALVDHGRSGLLVPPGDSGALARTILDLLSDPDAARRLGALGRAVIRRDYHPDTEARLLADVYRQALDRDDPGAPSGGLRLSTSNGR